MENGDARQGFRVTQRDLDLLYELNRLKLLNIKQIAALFFVRPPRMEWDAGKARSAAAKRVATLVKHGYLNSSYAPGDPPAKCYYLGPNGAVMLKADEETDVHTPRYAERKETYMVSCALHDLPMNSFIINAMLLDRVDPGFSLYEVWGEQECKFRFSTKSGNKIEFKPDALIRATHTTGRCCFFELHRGSVNAANMRSKLIGHAEFIRQGLRSLLDITYNPTFCWITPDTERLKKVARCISEFISAYGDTYPYTKKGYYYLSTEKELDIRSVENGRISESFLKDGRWYNERLSKYVSPFNKEAG